MNNILKKVIAISIIGFLIAPMIAFAVIPSLTGISVTPIDSTVALGGQVQMVASPIPTGADLGVVTWTMSATLGGAKIDSATGLFTAGTIEEIITITATSGLIIGTTTINIVNLVTQIGGTFETAITDLATVVVSGLGIILPVVAVLIGLAFAIRYVRRFIGGA